MDEEYVKSYVKDVFEDLYLNILEPYMERIDRRKKQGYRQALKEFRKQKRMFVRGLRRKTAEEQEAAAVEYRESEKYMFE